MRKDSHQTRLAGHIVKEAGRVVVVHDAGTGEDGAQVLVAHIGVAEGVVIRVQGHIQFFPVYQIRAHRMSPGEVAMPVAEGIVLEE